VKKAASGTTTTATATATTTTCYYYYYYFYIHLMAFFQANLGKPAPERSILDFTGARDDGVAVASTGPHANHLQLAVA